jgi:DNA-binding response OmpR family regulator
MAKVLIIIPDSELNEYIAFMLRGRGYQVDAQRKIADALTSLAGTRPDLLIVSQRHNERNPQGFDILRKIYFGPLLLIGDAIGSTAEALVRSDLLPLPFNSDALLKRVEAAISSRVNS